MVAPARSGGMIRAPGRRPITTSSSSTTSSAASTTATSGSSGGQNLAAFRLPASNWIAGANECDRLVDRAGGGQEKQFRCGYEIRLDMEPLSVIDDIRQGCNGRLAEVGGVFKTLVGAPGAAVYSFTDDDILVTEDQSFEPFPSLSETHNGIGATYPEPSEKWTAKDAPARYSSTLEADDGNRRLVTGVDFPAVPFGRQVQTLMKAMIEEERRFRTHLFHLPPDASPLEPNDAVAWTSSRNGYANKKFLVVRVIGKLTFNQIVVLKEIDPSDYSWSGADELPTDIGWLGPIEPPVQPMYGWQVEPASLLDDAGVPRRPSMRVSCAPDQDDVRQVRIQVRLKSSQAQVFDGQIAYDAPHSWILNGTFLPNTIYQTRAKFVPISSRKTDWSNWLDVTTPNARFGDGDVYLPGMIEDLQDFTEEATDWLRDGVRELITEQQRIVRLIAEQDFANFSDKQTLRRELVSRAGDITASYKEEIIAATGPGSALVARLTTLEAKIPTLATVTALDAVTASVTQQGNSITAYGLRIDSLEVEMPGKASVSAVNSLDTRVTNNEGVISAQANSISSLFAALGGKLGRCQHPRLRACNPERLCSTIWHRSEDGRRRNLSIGVDVHGRSGLHQRSHPHRLSRRPARHRQRRQPEKPLRLRERRGPAERRTHRHGLRRQDDTRRRQARH